jgi:hypothetical protein
MVKADGLLERLESAGDGRYCRILDGKAYVGKKTGQPPKICVPRGKGAQRKQKKKTDVNGDSHLEK